MTKPADAETWDAIVIGAGPAGAIAARQIALAGARVLLVERKPFPRTKVCGACWSAAGLEVLESIGLKERVNAQGGIPLTRFCCRSAAGEFALPLPGGLAVTRAAMDDCLAQAAIDAGVCFRANTRAEVCEQEGPRRIVVLHAADQPPLSVKARLVIAADGLGHPSLARLPQFASRASVGSRIGAGCEVPNDWGAYGPGTIHMAIGRFGYVGLVVVETGFLNIAAAIDARWLRQQGGPGRAAAAILAEAHCPAIPSLECAQWHGTVQLTRREARVAGERLLLIGDAAGYEEPFTGEGMTWAAIAGCAVAPLARRAIDCWQPELADAWTAAYRQTIGPRQRVCRTVSAVLRSRWSVAAMTRLLALTPAVARPLVKLLNAPPIMLRNTGR
jgi:flavin-dependent dehydrogenase